ncbi:hypothetical protein OB919_16000 [Halobacteria archaeon AArc-curdl1]|uniref:Uncharacterized protein n=1 Tax=Natronosalvus hydrolyticus TaxID=2979988 RepID=A0AAP2ZAK1_9EURY|nr:hypothetical protein [Halobacteria archaeon AArc-curdl1]
MKDLLVQENLESIKSKLRGRTKGSFVSYREVNQKPEQTGEGRKILFSDGQRVRAESKIINVREGEIRCNALTPVNRPHPKESPKENGFKYVDATQCGNYHIKLMGIEHSYRLFTDVLKAVLEHREPARNELDVLKHIIWTEVQDLDLNQQSDFEKRIGEGILRSKCNEIQVRYCQFPPTDPEQLQTRFNQSTGSRRRYQGLQGYVESAAEFYRKRGEKSVTNRFDQYFDFQDQATDIEVVKQTVKQKVAKQGDA